jgi:hypothetical protein
MFNFKKEEFDHRQGSMIDGRTTSRVAPCPGSPQLRVDIASKTADDVALTAVRVTRASPLLSVRTDTSVVPASPPIISFYFDKFRENGF